MDAPTVGSIFQWLNGPEGNLGVVTWVSGSGTRIKIRFDHGDEMTFAWPNAVLRRVVFPERSHVEILGTGLVGLVESAAPVAGNIFYSVELPGGDVTMVTELGVRPAVVTDPLKLALSGQFDDPRSTNLRLVATELLFSHQSGELSSLSNSRVEIKPHQVWVAHRICGDYPHRFLLADEVGLGKTIEAGLIIKELKARGTVQRILVLAPSGIVSQWQFELKNKFNETFAHYNSDSLKFLRNEHPKENVWTLKDQVIASTTFASWNEQRRKAISLADWDLVVIDEAHHARRGRPGTGSTQLYKLAAELAEFNLRRAFLLLTATPLQLHRAELFSLIEMLDPALFPSFQDFDQHCSSLAGLNHIIDQLRLQDSETELDSDVLGSLEDWLGEPADALMPRLVDDLGRESLIGALFQKHRLSEVMIRNGKTVVGGFMPRVAVVWPVDLTKEERVAYEAVTDYCRTGYAVAAASRNNALGFLMSTFQKLNSSSSYAVKQSLLRRIQKLDSKALPSRDSLPSEDLVFEEQSAADSLDPWLGVWAEDRDEEILRLREVVSALEAIKLDSKTRVLNEQLAELCREDPDTKVIIFTQSRDTQEYLRDNIAKDWTVHVFHGQLKPQDKDDAVARFKDLLGPQVLLSTEAGGEGRNFQFCHILINYDLPWNPMRIEQRIGRLDRIGQREPVKVINFSLRGTIEERVLEVLGNRIRVFEETIGGLDPILGEVEQDLRKIFLMAADESAKRLFQLDLDIERRVKEARDAEERLADLIMDARSFRQDETERPLNEEGRTNNELLRRFIINALVELDVSLREEPPNSGIYSLRFRGRFLNQFPEFVKEGIVRKATFDPSIAREREEIDFLAIGHELVDALLERVRHKSYGGRASHRRIISDTGPEKDGWFFTFGLEFDGVTNSKEVLPVFIRGEQTDQETAQWILARTERLKRETAESTVPREALEELESAAHIARQQAMLRVIARQEELSGTNRERANKERMKLDRFYADRQRAAQEKIEHAERILEGVEQSEDPEVRKIIPVWRTNLENARKLQAGLADEKIARLGELTNQEQVKARQRLITVSFVEVLRGTAPLP